MQHRLAPTSTSILHFSATQPMSLLFPDPPTQSTLADARKVLYATESSVEDITSKIDAAEAALAEIVKESRYVINEMQNERVRLEEQAFQARAYLSPIRRLPTELLRDIFMWSFEEYPCCAWVLAGVCVPWRRLALKMPRIWSKVCYSFSLLFRYGLPAGYWRSSSSCNGYDIRACGVINALSPSASISSRRRRR